MLFYDTYILLGLVGVMSFLAFQNRDFMDKYLFQPYAVVHNREYYRIVSNVFLHNDMGHLFFNSITLYFFGIPFEDYLKSYYGLVEGKVIFWVFVFLAMAASSLISIIRYKDNPNYRSLGLSGVTAAILFAMIMLTPDMKLMIIFLPIQMSAWIFGLLYLAFEIYSDRTRKTNIAHDAHISGAIFGILFILITNIDAVIVAFQRLFA